MHDCEDGHGCRLHKDRVIFGKQIFVTFTRFSYYFLFCTIAIIIITLYVVAMSIKWDNIVKHIS